MEEFAEASDPGFVPAEGAAARDVPEFTGFTFAAAKPTDGHALARGPAASWREASWQTGEIRFLEAIGDRRV